MIPLRQFHSEFISAPGCPILAAGKGGAFSGSSDGGGTSAIRARWQMTVRDLGEWRERAEDVSRARLMLDARSTPGQARACRQRRPASNRRGKRAAALHRTRGGCNAIMVVNRRALCRTYGARRRPLHGQRQRAGGTPALQRRRQHPRPYNTKGGAPGGAGWVACEFQSCAAAMRGVRHISDFVGWATRPFTRYEQTKPR